MKYLQPLFLVMIISLCTAQEIRIKGISPPAEDIYDEIIGAEKELEAHENGTSANFYKVHAIIALSKITPKVWDGTYMGVLYNPSHQDIMLWKEWYSKNRYYLSYDPLNERCEGLLDDEKIIVLKLPNGTICKSRTEGELDSLEKIYQYIQSNKKQNQ